MADRSLKIYVSPLSTQFTEAGTTVDVQIYKLEGNDGWTLEIGIDDDTSIAWTQSSLTTSPHGTNLYRQWKLSA